MKPFTALLLLLAQLVLPAVSLASAAELEWNQERVAALAPTLIEPLEALRAGLESRPSVPGKETARAAVMSDVERLRLRARELAQRLANGAGRAETVALFREIEAMQSQAANAQFDAVFAGANRLEAMSRSGLRNRAAVHVAARARAAPSALHRRVRRTRTRRAPRRVREEAMKALVHTGPSRPRSQR
jgi:hypothetical protein